MPPRNEPELIWARASSRPLLIDTPYAELSPVSVSTAPMVISDGSGAAERPGAASADSTTDAARIARLMITPLFVVT